MKITPSEKGPYYFVYLPQSFADEETQSGIPTIAQRSAFHFHLIGPMLHFALDSGYTMTFKEQGKLLRTISEKYKDYYKFANYHVPIFPSCFSSSSVMSTQQTIDQAIEYWLPVFQDFKFLGAFENHVHQ